MKRPNDMRPTSTVERITKLDITGNIIPPTWYQTILMPTGRPDMYAIQILSDFVYWHKARRAHNPRTREFIGWERKFYGDKFQANYKAIAKKFNMPLRATRDAIYRLIELGVLIRELRTVVSRDEFTMTNVPYWDIDVDVLVELTYPKEFPIGALVGAEFMDDVDQDSEYDEQEKTGSAGGGYCSDLQDSRTDFYNTNTKTSYETSLTALTSNEVKVSQAQLTPANSVDQEDDREIGTYQTLPIFGEQTISHNGTNTANGNGKGGTTNSSARKPKKVVDPEKVAQDWLWIERLADILGVDPKINAGRLGKTRNALRTSGYTLDDLDIYARDVWPSSWKAKNESHPKENDLRNDILEARKIRERREGHKVEQPVVAGKMTIIDPFGEEIEIDYQKDGQPV